MFSEKIDNWKQISAGFAIFGFLLSIITGLIGRVGFGIIIIRALIFALVFACMALLIMKLLESFIPELFNTGDDDLDENQESSAIIEDSERDESVAANGSRLDITIEDDEAEAVEGIEELGAAGDSLGDSVQYAEPSGASEPEELEEVEAAVPVEDAESEAGPVPAAPDTAGDDGDMPDIGVFSDSFTPTDLAGNSEGLSSIDGMGGSGSAEILGDMHETQEIVKAVKTVLKKDQEG
ncbi:MAG: hypothetical protein PQJ61_17660 [Spirochaetales bacterium]|uniref:Uncharacterized protein n=1 Tax=Candidatus Thalassospirochaeta sargassi TaxID=3119039 RepID=A0AAJ1IIL4_9SPIO|nr:hypothetical protein [Spirochaetales bacterium]